MQAVRLGLADSARSIASVQERQQVLPVARGICLFEATEKQGAEQVNQEAPLPFDRIEEVDDLAEKTHDAGGSVRARKIMDQVCLFNRDQEQKANPTPCVFDQEDRH